MDRPLLLSSNSLWNICHFRASVVTSLAAEGYRLLAAVPPSADVTTNLPLELVPIPLDRSGLDPFADFRLLLAYRRLLRRHRPAAFLSWTIKPNIYGALAARLARVPAIVNVSGLGTAFLGSGLLSRFVGMLYRLAFARTEVIYFQNADDRDLFVRRRLVRGDQTRLLPGSGIDLEAFSVSEPRDGPIIFLLVARLLGDKGIREYVAAARLLRSQRLDLRFQLLGPVDTDNRSAIAPGELQSWIADGVIEYLGAADDVRPQLAAASVVVLPSYREGLPRTLLEAAATGRPLIATDVAGCRDVVEEGVNGFLCNPRDVDGLAAVMRRMAELDQHSHRRMGEASRQLVERKFSQELVSEAYLCALHDIVKPTE